jgi:hypothetical protein
MTEKDGMSFFSLITRSLFLTSNIPFSPQSLWMFVNVAKNSPYRGRRGRNSLSMPSEIIRNAIRWRMERKRCGSIEIECEICRWEISKARYVLLLLPSFLLPSASMSHLEADFPYHHHPLSLSPRKCQAN